MRELHRESAEKIVLLVMDGLGGLAINPGGPTELEYAATPNMDRLASQGTLGQIVPIRAGITPGSGPAHLALFGYDPLEFEVGRGVLEATGIGLTVKVGDVAARGNFCTLDKKGNISDRRAGRISSEEGLRIVERLTEISIPKATFEIKHVKEYRFALILRGDDYGAEIDDTDPQQVGVPPEPAKARERKSKAAAKLFDEWITAAGDVLNDEEKANGLTLRGFSTNPQLPSFGEIHGVSPVCVAVYPMYRGVSKLVGMTVHEFDGDRPQDEFQAVSAVWDEFDFFFIHIKKTDSKGEDGDFKGKAKVIETVDKALPILLENEPSALVITGDHSTPSRMRTHSWHPVPLLLWAPGTQRSDGQGMFGETYCAKGGLGTFPSTEIMSLLMAHALRLDKFGA
jgi:2,3-bisphosphoglycerate-independent phosphoglycerate mutase